MKPNCWCGHFTRLLPKIGQKKPYPYLTLCHFFHPLLHTHFQKVKEKIQKSHIIVYFSVNMHTLMTLQHLWKTIKKNKNKKQNQIEKTQVPWQKQITRITILFQVLLLTPNSKLPKTFFQTSTKVYSCTWNCDQITYRNIKGHKIIIADHWIFWLPLTVS